MKIIYAGNRPFASASEAAREVERLSGEDASVWQISRALLWNKGFVNGIPVFSREIEEPDAAEEAEGTAPSRRSPLIRITDWYSGGIPPRWR
jgi:hypothetical protein